MAWPGLVADLATKAVCRGLMTVTYKTVSLTPVQLGIRTFGRSCLPASDERSVLSGGAKGSRQRSVVEEVPQVVLP